MLENKQFKTLAVLAAEIFTSTRDKMLFNFPLTSKGYENLNFSNTS